MHGVFHGHGFFASLVVVDQFNVKGVVPFKAEDDSPVGPHRHGPKPLHVALERVQAIPGDIESLRRYGAVENREDPIDHLQQVGPYPAAVVALIKPLQAAMLEAPNQELIVK
jgi:hypothetical protein